ncbi:TOMM precursor leader peptide-binding protein [Streptomyces sp. NPDC002032]|uniref:TOMM precursor leader peptide-binding protein n=2 Tax=unclassified Streptomyces TaxID=2593676 RepID=UPI0036790428
MTSGGGGGGGGAGAPRIGFKNHLRAEVVPGEATYLLSERNVTALPSPSMQVLAPLLDGTRTMRELVDEASAELTAAEVGRTLRGLASAGLVGFRADGAPADPSADAYWDLAGLDGPRSSARLATRTVEILALGDTDPKPAAEACRASGLTVSPTPRPTDPAADPAAGGDAAPDGDPAAHAATDPATHADATRTPDPAAGGDAAPDGDPAAHAATDANPATNPNPDADASPALTLVLCDDYLDPRLRAIDARQRAAGRPWLLARTSGADTWVGPLFRPGEGACWSCLASRLRDHRMSESPVRQALGLDGPVPRPHASIAAGRALGLHTAVLEAAKWLAGTRHPGQDAVWTLDTLTLESRHHTVSRRPQCPDCGNPGLVAEQTRRPVTVESRPKAVQVSGGHRALTPQQMLDRYGHLVSPVTGVVQQLRRDPRTPPFLHSYTSGRNLAAGSGQNLASLRAGLRSLSGGKGVTELDAKVSTLCETVERYCGTRQGDELVVRDSLRGLGEIAVHPDTSQLFDPRQVRDRERWNALHSGFQYVCSAFDEREAMDWTPVWSLGEQRQRLLPTSLLYFDTVARTTAVRADSNGNAAGSSREDAIVQGFLELVERDAVALWWYNRTRQPAVDLTSFDDPWLERTTRAYADMNRRTWVLDLTSDLGIPVMVALSRRTDKPAEDVLFGFGAHFDPRIALRRAVTEMNQLLPAVADVRPDGTGYGVDDPTARAWWTGATVAGQPYLLPDPNQAPRTPGSYTFVPRADLREDVDAIVGLTRARGLDLMVLDQTRPDIGLPVVKVLVPGLRHFWARFAPGRLFDVPVALGRLSEPTRYEDLNPVPLFV